MTDYTVAPGQAKVTNDLDPSLPRAMYTGQLGLQDQMVDDENYHL